VDFSVSHAVAGPSFAWLRAIDRDFVGVLRDTEPLITSVETVKPEEPD